MQSGLKPLGSEKVWVWVLLAPTLLGLAFGVLGSVLATVGISFFHWDLITPPTLAGLVNFTSLVDDRLFRKAFVNTFVFAALYVPSVMVCSLIVALLLNRAIRGLAFFRTAYFLPAISSAVAVGLVWSWIFAKDTGVLNYLITLVGGEPVNWLGTRMAMVSVVIMNVWGAVGEGAIILLAGLQAVPRTLYDAAEVDGANEGRKFWHVTLPLLTPAIFFQLIITTINAFQAFEFIYVLTRGGPNGATTTLVYSIYRNGFDYFRMGFASAQALVLAAIIFVLTLFYFWLQRKWVVYE